MFIDGKTPFTIAKTLTSESIPTPRGKADWGAAVVESILTNEKYKGAALLHNRQQVLIEISAVLFCLKTLDFKGFSAIQDIKRPALESFPGRVFLVFGGRSGLPQK